MKPELQTLWEIEKRVDGDGAVVLHWPSRRVYIVELVRGADNQKRFQPVGQGDLDAKTKIGSDYGKRVWVFRTSV